jgi:hypothetical protein
VGERAKLAVKVSVTVGVTGLATLVGYDAGGLTGAEIGTVLPAIVTDLMSRRRRNVVTVAEDAANLAGMDAAQLVAWVEADKRHAAFFLETLEAAWNTLEDDHLQALSYVLADGFQDDARIDIGQFVVEALRELEPAHVRVLSLAEQTERPSSGIDIARVIESAPGLAEGMPAIRAALERTGCIARADASDYGGPVRLWVTGLGRTCLSYLRDARPEHISRVDPAP